MPREEQCGPRFAARRFGCPSSMCCGVCCCSDRGREGEDGGDGWCCCQRGGPCKSRHLVLKLYNHMLGWYRRGCNGLQRVCTTSKMENKMKRWMFHPRPHPAGRAPSPPSIRGPRRQLDVGLDVGGSFAFPYLQVIRELELPSIYPFEHQTYIFLADRKTRKATQPNVVGILVHFPLNILAASLKINPSPVKGRLLNQEN